MCIIHRHIGVNKIGERMGSADGGRRNPLDLGEQPIGNETYGEFNYREDNGKQWLSGDRREAKEDEAG